MKISIQKIQKAYQQSPPNVRYFVGSDDLATTLNLLIKKYSLNKEQENKLGELIVYTLIGMLPLQNVRVELQNILYQRDVVGGVLEILNHQVFQPILNESATLPSKAPKKPALVHPPQHLQTPPRNSSSKSQPATTLSETERKHKNIEENKPLIDHIRAFEERKKKLREKEKQQHRGMKTPPAGVTTPAPQTTSPTENTQQKTEQEQTTHEQKKATTPPTNLPTASGDVVEQYLHEREEKNKPYGDQDPYREPIN